MSWYCVVSEKMLNTVKELKMCLLYAMDCLYFTFVLNTFLCLKQIKVMTKKYEESTVNDSLKISTRGIIT